MLRVALVDRIDNPRAHNQVNNLAFAQPYFILLVLTSVDWMVTCSDAMFKLALR